MALDPPPPAGRPSAYDNQAAHARATAEAVYRAESRRVFATLDKGFHDGIRADVDGNIWCGTGFGGEGVDGVHVSEPDGTKLGQVVMPEGTANLCFVGRERNRLFMTASQSVYTLYTAAQGAHMT